MLCFIWLRFRVACVRARLLAFSFVTFIFPALTDSDYSSLGLSVCVYYCMLVFLYFFELLSSCSCVPFFPLFLLLHAIIVNCSAFSRLKYVWFDSICNGCAACQFTLCGRECASVYFLMQFGLNDWTRVLHVYFVLLFFFLFTEFFFSCIIL